MKFYRIKLNIWEFDDSIPHGAQVLVGAPNEDQAVGMAIDEFAGADVIEPYRVEEIYPTSMIINQVYFDYN